MYIEKLRAMIINRCGGLTGVWVNFKPMPVGIVIPLTPPPYTLVCLAEIGIPGISRLRHLKIIFILLAGEVQ